MTTMKVFDGSTWQTASLPAGTNATTYVGPEAPPGPFKVGDLWYDTDDVSTLVLPMSVVNGGTGASTPPTARAALAVPAVGNSTTVAGAPTTGTWARGDEWVDSAGVKWQCTVAGTPGTWINPMGVWTAYTPAFTGTSSNPSVGNGTLTGRYLIQGKRCDVVVRAVFGTSGINGGGGVLLWSLPTAAAGMMGPAINGSGALYCPIGGLVWHGYANLYDATRFGIVVPGSASVSSRNWWQSADASAAPSTGIPNVSPNYNVQNNGYAWVAASYEIP